MHKFKNRGFSPRISQFLAELHKHATTRVRISSLYSGYLEHKRFCFKFEPINKTAEKVVDYYRYKSSFDLDE